MSRALLVDGNNILARAAHAAKHANMSVNGTDTAALVIWINLLGKHVRQVQPTHLCVYWDAGYEERTAAYPGYKAARVKHEDGTPDTMPMAQAKEFLTWANLPHGSFRGWEADDLIAIAARHFSGEVVILSGDKDLLQLVSATRTQIRPPDDEPWTEERVYEKFGVPPERLACYLALVGDPGDGVPGVRGIGPKKAVKALEEAAWDWHRLLASLEPQQAHEARLMLSLVDLRDRDYPWPVTATAKGVPAFQPTTSPESVLWQPLAAYLTSYRLVGIRERIDQGSLWTDLQAATRPDEALFESM